MTSSDGLVGRVLGGRYRIEESLGQGAMGAVYAAVQLDLARPVALKTMHDAADLPRFRTEALAAASLAHPNIVVVSDFVAGRGADPPFIVMELLRGRSLARILAERRLLPVATAVHIARQMLAALSAAHAAHIIHRDIKPSNVVVLDGGDPDAPWIKVVDFGIAKLMDEGSRHTQTGIVLGTPAYMAPEQHAARPPTPACDVWAVGACLFEMLAGSRAFPGSLPEIFTAAPHVSAELAAIVARALERDPAARFPDAGAMLAALDGASRAAPTRDAPVRRRWVAFVVAAAVAFGLAIAGALAIALVTRRTPPELPDAAPSLATASSDVAPEASDAAVPDGAAPVPTAVASPAPTSARSPLEPCFCFDFNIALCAEPVLACQCATESGQTLCFAKWPNDSCDQRGIAVHASTDRSGETCTAWAFTKKDGVRTIVEATGKLRCDQACSLDYARAHPTLAVPGTPCTGFSGTDRRAGKWRAAR